MYDITVSSKYIVRPGSNPQKLFHLHSLHIAVPQGQTFQLPLGQISQRPAAFEELRMDTWMLQIRPENVSTSRFEDTPVLHHQKESVEESEKLAWIAIYERG